MAERSERTSYAPGTPSWVDLGSPDAKAAADFYGGLFGWKAEMDPGRRPAATACFRSTARTSPAWARR